MKYPIRISGALLAAAAGAVSIGVLPSIGALAAGPITVLSAGIVPGEPGVLTVQVDDGTDNQLLTSLTVHINQGTKDVLDVTDMALASGSTNPADQTWTATAPMTLTAGTYTMTVDATDPTQTVTGISAGTLSYIYTNTQISASLNPPSINFGQQTTISGQLTGSSPNGGATAVGIGGAPVYLFNILSAQQQQIATTASNGDYSATIRPGSVEYVVQTATSSMAQGAQSGNVDVGFTSNYPTRISVKVSPQDFIYGHVGTATVTGSAQYEVGSSWLPLANSIVYGTAGTGFGYLPTDATGHFHSQFTPSLPDGTSWSFQTDAPGVQTSQAYGNVHIAVPMSLLSFSASLDSFGFLHVHGCAVTTVQGANQPGGQVTIQYATSPSGPWLRLGRVSMNASGSCASGNYFSGSVPVRLTNAYYRGRYFATVDYQGAVTRVVHEWKYLTRVVGLKVSPGSVPKNGRITVRGRLEKQAGRGWRSYAHRQILIILRPKGSKKWLWIYKVNTDSRGYFSKTFKDPVTAAWSAEYEGDSTHFASSGAIVSVRVGGASLNSGWSASLVRRLSAVPLAW